MFIIASGGVLSQFLRDVGIVDNMPAILLDCIQVSIGYSASANDKRENLWSDWHMHAVAGCIGIWFSMLLWWTYAQSPSLPVNIMFNSL